MLTIQDFEIFFLHSVRQGSHEVREAAIALESKVSSTDTAAVSLTQVAPLIADITQPCRRIIDSLAVFAQTRKC